MKKLYIISINGCDDSTYVKIELTDSELQLVNRICEASKTISTYQCMPTMEVEVVTIQLT